MPVTTEPIVGFAETYADQNERSYAAFQAAVPCCCGPGAAGMPAAPGPGYGRCHTWAASPAVQSQICSWVPEPPKLVSSRHLFDCGL